ncbi:hypothetical protein KC850_01000 [Candidatus Kaiserbacteria bacterium]|nr:hypothetical protein [Candidatus Kaiserbacteria bacterium]MCB9818523.1 hypothetical protein [Candidatus Nomurabacteria bacterium]
MGIIISIILYFIILFSVLQNHLYLSVIAVLLFSVKNGGVTLIPLAILIDGYFGNFYNIPYLSLLSVWWFLVVEYIKPKIVNLKFVNS